MKRPSEVPKERVEGAIAAISDTVDGHKAVETSEAILASEDKESDNTIYDDHWHQAEINDEPQSIDSDASVQFSNI